MISVRSKRWRFDRRFLIQRRSFWFDSCSNMMFSWWSRFDFLNFKHECFVRSDKTNLNQRLKKEKFVCESRLSRRFVCFERSLKHNDESIMFRFAYSQWIYYVSLFSLNDQSDTSLLCFIIEHLTFNCEKILFISCSRISNEHNVNNFDIMWDAMQKYSTTT